MYGMYRYIHVSCMCAYLCVDTCVCVCGDIRVLLSVESRAMRAASSSRPAAQDTCTHTHTHTLTGLGGVAARCCHSQSELANLHVNEARELSSSRLTGAPSAPPYPSLTGLGRGEWGGLRTAEGRRGGGGSH